MYCPEAYKCICTSICCMMYHSVMLDLETVAQSALYGVDKRQNKMFPQTDKRKSEMELLALCVDSEMLAFIEKQELSQSFIVLS